MVDFTAAKWSGQEIKYQFSFWSSFSFAIKKSNHFVWFSNGDNKMTAKNGPLNRMSGFQTFTVVRYSEHEKV
jgi:hypothetical protein